MLGSRPGRLSPQEGGEGRAVTTGYDVPLVVPARCDDPPPQGKCHGCAAGFALANGEAKTKPIRDKPWARLDLRRRPGL